MKTKKVLTILFLSTGVFFAGFLFAKSAHASESGLVINEIYPYPDSSCDKISDPSCDKEWIELYNGSVGDIDLNLFTIEDGTHKPVYLKDKIILKQSYIVLESAADFSFGLNNDGDEIILKQDQTVIDEVTYNSVAKATSLSRIPNGFDSDSFIIDFSVISISKGSENIKPPPIVYTDSIIINELLPQPEDGADNEFIELFNTGLSDVDLSNWQLDDVEGGGSSPYIIPKGTIIHPQSYLVFYKNRPDWPLNDSLTLNDNGDSARLIDPNGVVKSMISYDLAAINESYSFLSNTWSWTKQFTPGEQNIPDSITPIQENNSLLKIQEAKRQQINQQITISGKATSLPGDLSEQYFYMEDASGGIQVYSYYKLFPSIKLGDLLQVTGILTIYHGEFRLKISTLSDILVLSTQPPVTRTPLVSPPSQAVNAGILTSFNGKVIKNQGQTITLTNNSVTIKVYISTQTKIKKPKLKIGDTLEITGILSYYNESFRILPRYQSDIKIIKTGNTLPEAGGNILAPLVMTMFSLLIIYLVSSVSVPRKQVLIVE